MRHRIRRRRDIRAPAGCFVNQEHRKNTLLKGVTNEMNWTRQTATECQETTFKAHLLPMPGSEWVPSETDMEVVGIAATNEPRAYLMTLDLEGIRHLLPSIGAAVTVELDVDQIFHIAPKFRLENGALDDLVAEIKRGLARAEIDARLAVTDLSTKINEQLRDEGREGDKIRTEEVRHSLTAEHFRELAKDCIYPYNANVSDEATSEVPSEDTELRRMYDAGRFASELRMGPNEPLDEHTQRIKDWIRRNEVTSQIPSATTPFVGHRIKLPTGITADVALFVLEVPLQLYWPDGYQHPPMTLDIVKPAWPTDLSKYLHNIRESPQAVSAQISHKMDEKSFLMEDWAVERMSRLQEESLGHDWWEFSTRFHDIPASERTDLLKWFPALRTQLDNGSFEGEYAKVVEAMARSRAGKVIINGPAGSERSNFALSVAHAVMSEAPEPPVIVSSIPDTDDSRHVQYSLWELEKERDTYVVYQMAMWNNMSAEEKDRSRKSVDEFVPVTGRVAWIAPQESHVDEAVQRLIAMNPGKTILRISSYVAEIHNLVHSENSEIEPTAVSVASGMSRSETQIIEAYNDCLHERDRKRYPATNKHSWSEQCLSRGHFDDSECWSEMGPMKRGDYWNDAEDALSCLLERADAICATPSAFDEIYKRVGRMEFKPSFIIVDNANQLTEASSLVASSIFPDVPTMFIGDLEKDGPEVMASEESLRTSMATKRRTRSLLQRVEDAGYLDYQLFPDR